MGDRVFSVHTTHPGRPGTVEVVHASERAAREYAADRSRDDRELAASVTAFRIGELGTRQWVAWYVDGEEQPLRFDRPNLYPDG